MLIGGKVPLAKSGHTHAAAQSASARLAISPKIHPALKLLLTINSLRKTGAQHSSRIQKSPLGDIGHLRMTRYRVTLANL
jgi:hypothetical protein